MELLWAEIRVAFISSSISADLTALAQSYIWFPVDQMIPDCLSQEALIDEAEHSLAQEYGFASAIWVQLVMHIVLVYSIGNLEMEDLSGQFELLSLVV